MIIFDYVGEPLTHQKVVPGNTITSLSSSCYVYKVHRLNFDAGTDEVVAGDWMVGATSAAAGKALYVSVASGTWAGDNAAGYILYDSWNGTAWTDNEKVKVAADATMLDVNQPAGVREANDEEYLLAGRFQFKGRPAIYALVIVYANTALVGINGGKPDQTGLIGTPMVANSSLSLKNHQAIRNFQCVDYTAASASIVQVDFFF